MDAHTIRATHKKTQQIVVARRCRRCRMGACQSAESASTDVNVGEWCPTVFELERRLEEKRRESTRLHPNLVNIEFRRGLFEIYEKGPRLDTSTEDKEMFIATHKSTGRAYAVREISLPINRDARVVEELWRGFDAQSVLDHPNICRLQEVFCSEERYYVVTDLCSGGDIIERLAMQGRQVYEELEVATIIRKITQALRHCHAESIVHGNLRTEMCLLEDTGPCADVRIVVDGVHYFSSSEDSEGSGGDVVGDEIDRSGRLRAFSDIGSSRRDQGNLSRSKRGKRYWYLAPEVPRGKTTPEGDMWTLGVVAYMVMLGSFPQPNMTLEAARTSAMMGKPLFKGMGWINRSPQASDFISHLLQRDPADRMCAGEALEHPWLNLPSGAPERLAPAIQTSLLAFRDSCFIRRLGLRIVGRTLELAKLLPIKQVFGILDPTGKGYISEEDLIKAMQSPMHLFQVASGNFTTNLNSNGGGGGGGGGGHTMYPTTRHDLDDLRAVVRAMDPESLGRVGFSTLVAACLAGRPADEPGCRAAFERLDRRRKRVIIPADMNVITGKVLTLQELEDAFATGHEALDEQSTRDDSLVGSQIREREARNSAASGSAGGFSYGEFYRLLAEVPSCPHPAATGMSASGYASQAPISTVPAGQSSLQQSTSGVAVLPMWTCEGASH